MHSLLIKAHRGTFKLEHSQKSPIPKENEHTSDRSITMSETPTPVPQLQAQWENPGDILSLLLLIGGDVVQKALAQLSGVYIQPSGLFKKAPRIFLTPVAFSFGWVAYSFNSLMALAGDSKLMPDIPDYPSIVINCSNAYQRINRSWILGRILRDHESQCTVNREEESIRIDIFTLTGMDENPDIDKRWLFGWVVIFIQQALATVPWVLYGDWTILMVTWCGTIGALITGMLPQWESEKWCTRKTAKAKTIALTRGNGHAHVMIFIKDKGQETWDLEGLATGGSRSHPETFWICSFLVLWWVLLLITVSGLKAHSWFLIGIGGIGMFQNVFTAGASRTAGSFNIHFKPHSECPVIIGRRRNKKPLNEPLSKLTQDEEFDPLGMIGGVMGALMALEMRFPRVGASLIPVFFPGNLTYEPGRLHFKWEKEFWEKAFGGFENSIPIAPVAPKSPESDEEEKVF